MQFVTFLVIITKLLGEATKLLRPATKLLSKTTKLLRLATKSLEEVIKSLEEVIKSVEEATKLLSKATSCLGQQQSRLRKWQSCLARSQNCLVKPLCCLIWSDFSLSEENSTFSLSLSARVGGWRFNILVRRVVLTCSSLAQKKKRPLDHWGINLTYNLPDLQWVYTTTSI